MVLIGISHTRFGIGVGRVNINIIFGLPLFSIMTASGMLMASALIFLNRETEPPDLKSKKLTLLGAILFLSAVLISIFHTFFYNLNFLNLLLLSILGTLWALSLYYGKNSEYKGFLAFGIISVSISYGIIYGAALNTFLIPIYIYFLFAGTFALQFSKDLITNFKNKSEKDSNGIFYISFSLDDTKIQRISLLSNLIALLCFLVPYFLNIINSMLYIIFIIPTLLLIAIAVILHMLMNTEKSYYKTIRLLLRACLFLSILAMILGSV